MGCQQRDAYMPLRGTGEVNTAKDRSEGPWPKETEIKSG